MSEWKSRWSRWRLVRTATSNSTTQAYLGDSVTLTAWNLDVTATGSDYTYAETTTGSGGVVAGGAAIPVVARPTAATRRVRKLKGATP